MGDILLDMVPKHDFLVCIDSDGCIMDNMELKHKECFCPATVNVWNLQGVSEYARQAAEFVNLYSRTRGFNRFPALIRTLELTYARKEVQERGFTMPDLSALKEWIKNTPILSAKALEEYYQANQTVDPILEQAAAWSREVDANIARIVRNVVQFPNCKEAITKLREKADIVIVSATPHEALVRELGHVGIDKLVNVIAGQELGTKSQCIAKAMQGRYKPENVLKIGDALSDSVAAKDNGVLFRPIIPKRESACWNEILGESAERFFNGTYAGPYMDQLIDDFFSVLLEEPPWVEKV